MRKATRMLLAVILALFGMLTPPDRPGGRHLSDRAGR